MYELSFFGLIKITTCFTVAGHCTLTFTSFCLYFAYHYDTFRQLEASILTTFFLENISNMNKTSKHSKNLSVFLQIIPSQFNQPNSSNTKSRYQKVKQDFTTNKSCVMLHQKSRTINTREESLIYLLNLNLETTNDILRIKIESRHCNNVQQIFHNISYLDHTIHEKHLNQSLHMSN